jgi:N utilization substance protein B
MKHLRTAREAALQVLFQKSFQDDPNPQDLFHAFVDNFTIDNKTRDYALFLVSGVMEKEDDINSMISKYSENWSIDRMAMIDKILLQLAIFELCFSDQTPTAPKLAITDILDLAKKYSSQDSNHFINGVLDQVYQQELSAHS